MAPKSSGSGVSQNWALLWTSCVILGKEFPSLEPQYLTCKMGAVIGSVLQGWGEVNKITWGKGRATCLAESSSQHKLLLLFTQMIPIFLSHHWEFLSSSIIASFP